MQKRKNQDRSADSPLAFQAELCAYAGRPCLNQRAWKTNGQPLTLCALMHCARANESQRTPQEAKKHKTQATHGSSSAAPEAFVFSCGQDAPAGAIAMPWGIGTDRKCMYSNCTALRVAKSTGALHRYCPTHRDMARKHQTKYATKKREAMASSPSFEIKDEFRSSSYPFQLSFFGMQSDFGQHFDAFVGPASSALSGPFTLLMDNVPEAAAAHLWFNQFTASGPVMIHSESSSASSDSIVHEAWEKALRLSGTSSDVQPDDMTPVSAGFNNDTNDGEARRVSTQGLSVLMPYVSEAAAKTMLDRILDLEGLEASFTEWAATH